MDKINEKELDPHIQAVEELEKAMAEGDRFASDLEIVVLADLRSKPNGIPNLVIGRKKTCTR